MNVIRQSAAAVAFSILASPAIAAQDCNCSTSHGPAAAGSPYAGMQHRAVKAISEQQIADLRAGRGMGLALPAELNGYPGPVHVLELADALQLSDDQRARTKALFEAMKAETSPSVSAFSLRRRFSIDCSGQGTTRERRWVRPRRGLRLHSVSWGRRIFAITSQ